MNISKKMLLIAACFTINALDAKGGKKAQKPAATQPKAPAQQQPAQQQPAPGKQPAAQQPAMQKVNYKAIKDEILRAPQRSVITANNKLSEEFAYEKIISKFDNQHPNYEQTVKFFLQMARDKHLPLSNDDNENLKKFAAINQQINGMI